MKITELENGKYYKYVNSLGYVYYYHFNYYEIDGFNKKILYYYYMIFLDEFNVRYSENDNCRFRLEANLEEIDIYEFIKYLPNNHTVKIKFRKERINKLLCK